MPVLENAKWELFAQGVAKGLPAYKAYHEAGYDCDDKTAMESASRLSRNDKITERVEELQKKAAAKVGITVERTLQEIARMAFADPRKISGVDLASLDDDTAAACSVEVVDGEVTRVKILGSDKLKALEKCCNHLGIATPKAVNDNKNTLVFEEDGKNIISQLLKGINGSAEQPG